MEIKDFGQDVEAVSRFFVALGVYSFTGALALVYLLNVPVVSDIPSLLAALAGGAAGFGIRLLIGSQTYIQPYDHKGEVLILIFASASGFVGVFASLFFLLPTALYVAVKTVIDRENVIEPGRPACGTDGSPLYQRLDDLSDDIQGLAQQVDELQEQVQPVDD